MTAAFLWLKGLHVAFMVTWFAGLFYLPRLFIYHTQTADAQGRERFEVMEKRLFAIMTIGAVVTVAFGYSLVLLNTSLVAQSWFRLKLLLLVGLVIYHYRCYRWTVVLRGETGLRDTRWLRWFNEIPVIFLLGIVLLAVVKPF
jgi:putative membrane protein